MRSRLKRFLPRHPYVSVSRQTHSAFVEEYSQCYDPLDPVLEYIFKVGAASTSHRLLLSPDLAILVLCRTPMRRLPW